MFKLRATQRFSSFIEGNRRKGDVFEVPTRQRAYDLLSIGVVQILEGDDFASSLETKDELPSSLPVDPLRSTPLEARNVGVIGQPSRSTIAGVLTSEPPPSTRPTETGGASATPPPDSDTSTSSESSSTDPAGPATSQPPESLDSDSSDLSDEEDSPTPKAPSARAGRSGTAARKRST